MVETNDLGGLSFVEVAADGIPNLFMKLRLGVSSVKIEAPRARANPPSGASSTIKICTGEKTSCVTVKITDRAHPGNSAIQDDASSPIFVTRRLREGGSIVSRTASDHNRRVELQVAWRRSATMSPNVKKILEEAMQLEPGKRALIAETLLESLDFEENFEISQAWRDEVERRCAQIDHGTVELIDSDTAMAELRKKHG
jgi:hypothetical protein